MLYGASLMLEFVTLVVLRIREPELKREFRVPGGILGCVMVGVFPFALLLLSLVKSSSENRAWHERPLFRRDNHRLRLHRLRRHQQTSQLRSPRSGRRRRINLTCRSSLIKAVYERHRLAGHTYDAARR